MSFLCAESTRVSPGLISTGKEIAAKLPAEIFSTSSRKEPIPTETDSTVVSDRLSTR